MIPDFNEKTAVAIREFAIAEGIQPEILDTIVDPVIVKFVDDYRRLKQGVTKGSAKRKATVVKKAPVRKAKTRSQKEVDQETKIRAVLNEKLLLLRKLLYVQPKHTLSLIHISEPTRPY